jgi:hypothetical protein
MPSWRFRTLDLSLVHLGNRHMPKALRVFKDFAVQMARRYFRIFRRKRWNLLWPYA